MLKGGEYQKLVYQIPSEVAAWRRFAFRRGFMIRWASIALFFSF